MPKTMDKNKLDQAVAEARHNRTLREQGYREQALRLYPWVCGRCARTFDLTNLQQLTVHHKDHNHDNNPANGSNWELLCIYCHDNEHSKYLYSAGAELASKPEPQATYQPFADLKSLRDKKGLDENPTLIKKTKMSCAEPTDPALQSGSEMPVDPSTGYR